MSLDVLKFIFILDISFNFNVKFVLKHSSNRAENLIHYQETATIQTQVGRSFRFKEFSHTYGDWKSKWNTNSCGPYKYLFPSGNWLGNVESTKQYLPTTNEAAKECILKIPCLQYALAFCSYEAYVILLLYLYYVQVKMNPKIILSFF